MLLQVRKEAGNRLRPLKRYVKRLTTATPFQSKEDKALLVHCCHHKVGTVWFNRVLRKIAHRYGLVMYAGEQEGLPSSSADIFLQEHSYVDTSVLPEHRGAHMVRDVRDIIVSGYFYHVWTNEEWVHVPKDKYEGKTYQEYLNSLSQPEGISAEIKRFASSRDFHSMLSWDYEDSQLF